TELLDALFRSSRCDRRELQAHRNTIRALFAWNSRYFEISDVGCTWLQGVELDQEQARQFGIRPAREARGTIVKGLSWVMSLRAPTVLAFDQLDAIVAHLHLAAGDPAKVEPSEEQRTALGIIEGIIGGLASIVDQTVRTLPIVTAINATWASLVERGLRAHSD